MNDRKYLLVLGRWRLTYERALNFHWLPSRLWRFQRNGWHIYLWKFRLTRASAPATGEPSSLSRKEGET